MAVRVRLTRVGSKKNAMWRVVVADQRSPRDGRFIEMIGHYNPQTQPSQIVIDRERLDHWLRLGAQPTGTVRKLMRAENTDIGATTTAAPPEPAPAEAAPDAAPEADAAAEAEVDAGAEAEAGAAADATAGDEAEAAPESEATPEAEGDAAAADAAAEPEKGSG